MSMTPEFEDAIKVAVENVKKKVKAARGKYFDTYNVFDELRAVNKGKEYVKFLATLTGNDHPFMEAHKQIGRYLEQKQPSLGIEKVADSKGDPVRIYIPENIVLGSDTVQLWKIII